jgi:hypothetical protein
VTDARTTADEGKTSRTSPSRPPLGWEDIDAELSASARECGVGCGPIGAVTDSAMTVGMANLREAVRRRRAT